MARLPSDLTDQVRSGVGNSWGDGKPFVVVASMDHWVGPVVTAADDARQAINTYTLRLQADGAEAAKGIPGDHTDPCTRPDPPAHCRWANNHMGDR